MGTRADSRYVNPRLTADPRMYSPVHGRGYAQDDYYTQSSESTLTSSKEDNCLPWLKYGIFAANIVFMVVGSLLLAMGVWLRTDSRFRDFLSERYRQAVEEAFWEAPTLYAFSYIIIVLGCCMIVVAFFGCCGVNAESRLVLIIYSMAVFLLLVATLSCGIYLFYKKDGIDVELSDALNYMVQHYYQGAGIVQESLDHLQTTFRCCGNAGCSDFRAFRQDPPRSCDIRCDGCHYRIWVALSIGFSITLVVFFAVVICQVLALVFALYIVFTQPTRVRLVYVDHTKPEPTLTRETLQRHNLPYDLRKDRRRKYY
ncbi:hypothetical protein RB195_021654 [Necator americanus]|uniref:Tetraspanin n=1 Tax=Necator americanus TaxID=51031 RepID=A0ABR1EC24_NECAM